MTKRRRQSIHLFGSIGTGVDPIASIAGAIDLPDIAAELWRLQGRDDRASAIVDLLRRAYGRKPAHLDHTEVPQLLAQVEDLDSYTKAHLTDADGRITMDQVAALRPRAEYLELEESRGHDATAAVIEALHDVGNLIGILRRAMRYDASIVFD